MALGLTMFEYSQTVKDALTKEQLKEISDLYKGWADEVNDMASFYKKKETASSALSEQYYKQLHGQMQKTAQQVSDEIKGNVTKGIHAVSDAVVKDAADWVSSLGFNGKNVSQAYSYIPDDVVRNLVTGRIYESGWSLNKAIWTDNQKTQRDIYTIIAQGRAKQESVYETAKRLESYVSPDKALPWVGPNVTMPDGSTRVLRIYKHTVDYNAQRLVRTLNQHAYQQSFVQATKDNPFIEKYMWDANGSRVCELCAARNGQTYAKDKLPLDHPNGMCVMVPVLMDKDKMLQDLADWTNGKDNPTIDKFASKFGYSGKAPLTMKQFLDKYGETDMKYFNSWYKKLDDEGKAAFDKLVAASGEDRDLFFKKNISKAYDEFGKKVSPGSKVIKSKQVNDRQNAVKSIIGETAEDKPLSQIYNDIFNKFDMDVAEELKEYIAAEFESGKYASLQDVWASYFRGTGSKQFMQDVDDIFIRRGSKLIERMEKAEKVTKKVTKKVAKQETTKKATTNIADDATNEWLKKNFKIKGGNKLYSKSDIAEMVEALSNNDAPDAYKKLVADTMKKRSVGTAPKGRGSFYSPNTKMVKMADNGLKPKTSNQFATYGHLTKNRSFQTKLRNEETFKKSSSSRFTTLFHEYGHAIDDINRGNSWLSGKAFKKAMIKDMNELDKKVAKLAKKADTSYDSYKQLCKIQSDLFSGSGHGISDAVSAMQACPGNYESTKKLRVHYKHSTDYFRRNADSSLYASAEKLQKAQQASCYEEGAKELFANISASMIDKKERRLMQEYFPNALEEFENIVETVAKKKKLL